MSYTGKNRGLPSHDPSNTEIRHLRTLAIIPARGGSKRIRGKNTRPLHGKPLLAWTADFASGIDQFTRTLLSTDSPDILDTGVALGLSHNGLRPDSLSHDTATSIDVVFHELAQCAMQSEHFDCVALLQPTSPFRLKKRWCEAFSYIADGSAASVVSVSPAPVPPEHYFRRASDGTTCPLLPDSLTQRTQDIEPSYFVNGALYLARVAALTEARSFYAAPLKSVVCTDPRENIDLDTEADWLEAEALLAST